ncbi:MAG: 50S ribosomal protein L32 [Candidatus Omnitrophica bacterium]|nr:50S ribosomal protein L32 [Candidatus Omnitrophota bacterium]
MALPKRRHSHSRTRKRRTHDKVSGNTVTTCKECGARVRQHCICPKCGFYRGRRVITIKVKQKKKDEK